MNKGKIAYLGNGFGFIKIDGREKDLFFHATGLANGLSFIDLRVNDDVTFEDITSTERGPSAVGVEKA